ncbi:MAG: alpha/beta hydrolase [bacterium]
MIFRKVVLVSLFAIIISASAAVIDAQSQSIDTDKPVIVIVHGAWGGGWAFKKVDSILTQKGYTVYRPTLTGLGERVHLTSTEVGLSTHIEDVVNMILFEGLHDIILIGHSYGGMVITGVADRVPDRIRRKVYLDAFVPEDGESVLSIQGSRGDWVKKMEKDGFLIPFWVKTDQTLPKDVPHPIKTLAEAISLKNEAAKQIPTTYILTVEAGKKAQDDDFAMQAERAKTKGWTMMHMECDHNPQFNKPEELAGLLEKIK